MTRARSVLAGLMAIAALCSVGAIAGDAAPEPSFGLKLPTTTVAPVTSFDAPKTPKTPEPTPTPATPKGQPPQGITGAWLSMPEEGSGCGDDLNFDYGLDGGMRNIFCRALKVMSWRAFLASAPTSPWLKGPHKGTTLNFQAERDFGRYNPAFVRWATTALIPAATNPELRAQTQPIYDRQFKRLARLYFLVEKAMSANEAWVEAERRRYLQLMDDKGGGWNVWEITDPYHDVLGNADANWGGHDPNHVRAATMWWLRRAHDNTRPLWSDGLNKLLSTYDDLWLAEQQGVAPSPLPATTKAAPSAPE